MAGRGLLSRHETCNNCGVEMDIRPKDGLIWNEIVAHKSSYCDQLFL